MSRSAHRASAESHWSQGLSFMSLVHTPSALKWQLDPRCIPLRWSHLAASVPRLGRLRRMNWSSLLSRSNAVNKTFAHHVRATVFPIDFGPRVSSRASLRHTIEVLL